MKSKIYATLDVMNAMDFRSISKHMVSDGYKMGPSRVRLIMITTLEKIVQSIIDEHGKEPIDDHVIHEVAISPEFQNVIAPFIVQALKNKTEDSQTSNEVVLPTA